MLLLFNLSADSLCGGWTTLVVNHAFAQPQQSLRVVLNRRVACTFLRVAPSGFGGCVISMKLNGAPPFAAVSGD